MGITLKFASPAVAAQTTSPTFACHVRLQVSSRGASQWHSHAEEPSIYCPNAALTQAMLLHSLSSSRCLAERWCSWWKCLQEVALEQQTYCNGVWSKASDGVLLPSGTNTLDASRGCYTEMGGAPSRLHPSVGGLQVIFSHPLIISQLAVLSIPQWHHCCRIYFD